MTSQSNNYSKIDKNLKKQEELLDSIYKSLLIDREDDKALKKLDQLLKSKLDIRNILPISKSFEGQNILTISKFWMILILIKITKGRKQQEDFLTIINSSLTYGLNEYEEYRKFYEEQCEQLFNDEDAIKLINNNPKKEIKFKKPISHEEIKENYLYLLYRPEFFKKINFESISKIKKLPSTTKSKEKKEKNTSNKKSKSKEKEKEDKTETEIDEKGDRLNEDDMDDILSKINEVKKNRNKNKKNSENKKEIKEESESKNKQKKKKGRPKGSLNKKKEERDIDDTSKNEDESINNTKNKGKNKGTKKETSKNKSNTINTNCNKYDEIYNRLQSKKYSNINNIKALQKKKEEDELALCTFQPNINRISNSNSKNKNINKNQNKANKKQIQNNYERLYQEGKAAYLEKRRSIDPDPEDNLENKINCTFKPKINKFNNEVFINNPIKDDIQKLEKIGLQKMNQRGSKEYSKPMNFYIESKLNKEDIVDRVVPERNSANTKNDNIDRDSKTALLKVEVNLDENNTTDKIVIFPGDDVIEKTLQFCLFYFLFGKLDFFGFSFLLACNVLLFILFLFKLFLSLLSSLNELNCFSFFFFLLFKELFLICK